MCERVVQTIPTNDQDTQTASKSFKSIGLDPIEEIQSRNSDSHKTVDELVKPPSKKRSVETVNGDDDEATNDSETASNHHKTHQEEEEPAPVSKKPPKSMSMRSVKAATTAPTPATTNAGEKTRSRSKLASATSVEDLNTAEASGDSKITRKTSRARLTTKATSVPVPVVQPTPVLRKQEAEENEDEMSELESEQPKTSKSAPAAKPPPKSAAAIKKKSTFGRLTDLIVKSPILEPLRGIFLIN